MDFDITKVTIDGTVDDFSEDELRETVTKFQEAQESNVAEFEKAAEVAEEIDENKIEDFEDACDSLIEEITDAEAFDEVPLTEEALESSDFAELREWKEFVASDSEETDEVDEDGDGPEFDDMGNESPVNPDEETEDFIEDELDNIPGINL